MSFRRWLTDRLREKTLGERGEDYAARYLRRQGLRIVARRDRSRIGELDLVAVEGRTVVFVEVKTRRSDIRGAGVEAVDDRKQYRLTRAALTFLKAHGLLEEQSRFDVVELTWPRNARRPQVRHYRHAFSAVGKGQFFS